MTIYKTLVDPKKRSPDNASDELEEYISDDEEIKRIRDATKSKSSTEGFSKYDSQSTWIQQNIQRKFVILNFKIYYFDVFVLKLFKSSSSG